MADIVNLGSARSGRSANAADWTPVEALRYVLAEIEAGRMKPDVMYIAMLETPPDGEADIPRSIAAGTASKLEQIGLLSVHLAMQTS